MYMLNAYCHSTNILTQSDPSPKRYYRVRQFVHRTTRTIINYCTTDVILEKVSRLKKRTVFFLLPDLGTKFNKEYEFEIRKRIIVCNFFVFFRSNLLHVCVSKKNQHLFSFNLLYVVVLYMYRGTKDLFDKWKQSSYIFWYPIFVQQSFR